MATSSPYLRRARQALKTILLTFVGLIVFLALYLLAAYGLARIPTDRTASRGCDVSIYLLTNGVHTDVVVPIRTDLIDWSRQLRFEHTRGKDTAMQYVALGWGDKGFYLNTPTWGDLTAETAFKAASGWNSTAIHATFYKRLVEGPGCVKIELARDDYARLVEFVRTSFRTDSSGQFQYIETTAQYGQDDAFYEATGRYSLFYTCNTWANNALKSCGQKACWWTPFDTGIFYHYQ
jgi:uncharacterized protein (TIGR02117 family)